MDLSLAIYLSVILLLVLFSAFFSGSETGLTASSRAKIHKSKTRGDPRADIVSRLREDKEILIGTILLGNNAVNILASALATSIAISYFGEEGVIYATIAMTAMVLIFAEALPKTYAFYNAEKVSLKVARLLSILVIILLPLTKMVQVTVDFLIQILGIAKNAEDESSYVDELRGTIELHHQDGKVFKGEKDMLGGILDLSQTEVNEVMIHRKNIYSVNVNDSVTEIIAQVLDSEFTRVPVWKDKPDNIIGILHAKALLKELKFYDGEVNDLNITDIMTDPWFVPETNTLSNQLLQFRLKRNHLAVVVDEYGALSGLVTLEDILEEIVGHIDDEHDRVYHGILQLQGGKHRIKGDVTIRDVNRQLDWDIPDDKAATIAGFVIHEAETIPEIGQKFEFHGYSFKIETKQKNQITSLVVSKN